jgi:glycosyltransferase involved in cell wall biosynthesis
MEDPLRPDFFGDKFVLLNIGRHALEKRQETIIDAVLKSKYKDNILLLLCGRGEMTETLKERAKELPVEPLIRYVSEEEKHLYYNTSDLYVHSSRVELESRTCLEAIGCGLPCLIEDAPYSASSRFGLDDRFLFTSSHQDELTAKIDFWYEHRTSLVDYKKPILEMAEKYRIDNSIDAMEKLYEDVYNTHHGATGLLPEGEKIRGAK